MISCCSNLFYIYQNHSYQVHLAVKLWVVLHIFREIVHTKNLTDKSTNWVNIIGIQYNLWDLVFYVNQQQWYQLCIFLSLIYFCTNSLLLLSMVDSGCLSHFNRVYVLLNGTPPLTLQSHIQYSRKDTIDAYVTIITLFNHF